MTFRRTGKILTLVGFAICMSCLGVMYGNLTSISEERDSMRSKRNEIKREADEKASKLRVLEAEASKMEKSLASCKSRADLAVDKNRNLLEGIEQYKTKLLERDNDVQKKSEDKIQDLKDQIYDLKKAIQAMEESAESCKSSSKELQSRLIPANNEIVSLKEKLSSCMQSREELPVEDSKDPDKGVEWRERDWKGIGEHIIEDQLKSPDAGQDALVAIAAVPQPADKGRGPEVEVDNVGNVADIPENNQNNPVVDNKQDIPGAQAPAPLPVPAAPVIRGEQVKRDTGSDVDNDADNHSEDKVDEDKMGVVVNEIEPLQPIPDQALADSLAEVQQQEQQNILQERQNQLLQQIPQMEDALNNQIGELLPGQPPELQPAQPPELQPAQPPAPELQPAQPHPNEI